MVVVPMGKKLPAGTPVRVTCSAAGQLSSVVGVPNSVSPTTKPPHPVVSAGVSAMTFGGAVMVGVVVSFMVMVTVCVQLTARSLESVAVQVMVVVPAGYGASSV